jgi:hypothetical protein
MGALNADVMRAISDRDRAASPEAVLDRVFETLGESGHARLLAWAALTDRTAPRHVPGSIHPQEEALRVLADAVHRRLREEAGEAGGHFPRREEADFIVRLVAAAMLGDALMGDLLSRSGGLAEGPAVQRRFRNWLARLLDERLRHVVGAKRARRDG